MKSLLNRQASTPKPPRPAEAPKLVFALVLPKDFSLEINSVSDRVVLIVHDEEAESHFGQKNQLVRTLLPNATDAKIQAALDELGKLARGRHEKRVNLSVQSKAAKKTAHHVARHIKVNKKN